MSIARVIPCLLLQGKGLVKTTRFRNPGYIGDPRNAVRIFNEREVDELILLDIAATVEKRPPDFFLLREIASEAFMPVGYGGGLKTVEEIGMLFSIGFEKAIISSAALNGSALIREASKQFGCQSIVVCIDVKKNMWGNYEVVTCNAKKPTGRAPVDVAIEMAGQGAGEIIINAVDRDGTGAGYDLVLLKAVSERLAIPVVACGGAGTLQDFSDAIRLGGASAIAAGSMFVYHGKQRGVLISYPSREVLDDLFAVRQEQLV